MKAPTSSYVGGDPFGAEPTGASQNCGPEHRYKVNVDLKSKEDFVSYLKYNKIKDVSLDNFRRFGYFNYDKADDSFDNQINWTKIIEKTQIKDVGGRKVYTLEYNRISRGKSFVSTCSGYTLKITNDGHISTYGCCGK
ncbi:MAG: hypothetical protein HQ538_04070 [Parcubacteria group bacterium]|nr:hypothetical protein [Parcubacteria group bacterium]